MQLICILQLSYNVCVCFVLKPPNEICRDPDHIRHKRSRGHTISLENLLLIGQKQQTDESIDYFYAKTIDPVCPILERRSRLSLRRRSTCPWDHVISINEDRIPREISIVRCLPCEHCRATNRGQDCEPITKEKSVLMRGKCSTDGVYEWTSQTINVTVGCTCASKPLFVQTSDNSS